MYRSSSGRILSSELECSLSLSLKDAETTGVGGDAWIGDKRGIGGRCLGDDRFAKEIFN